MSFVRRWWRWMRCWLWAGWFLLHNDRDDAWQPCGLPQSVEPCVGNIAVPPDHNTTLQRSIHKSLYMGLHKILDMSCTSCISHHVICYVHHASASCNIWRRTHTYMHKHTNSHQHGRRPNSSSRRIQSSIFAILLPCNSRIKRHAIYTTCIVDHDHVDGTR